MSMYAHFPDATAPVAAASEALLAASSAVPELCQTVYFSDMPGCSAEVRVPVRPDGEPMTVTALSLYNALHPNGCM